MYESLYRLCLYDDIEGVYGYENSRCCNIDGKPVERDIYSHPYSYDPFVIWKGNYDPSDSAVYSDRLMQWDFARFNKCAQAVLGDERQMFSNCSPNSVERFLSLYFDKNIKLTGIQQGCNVSTGYSYWIFHYKTADK